MSPPHPAKDKSKDDYCESDCSSPPHPAPVPPPPSSSPGSHGRTNFFVGLIIAGSVLAFLIICLCLFLIVRRRRNQRRRRREALLEAAMPPAAPTANGDGGGGDVDLEEAGQADVVHHAWLIRTVGLDEAAIESIALTRYSAGAAGAPDCAVCLGEFADGELLRLLPRCAHAFHVHCIDTWLRAHVNCPLCRSHVLDPTDPAATEQSDSPVAAEDDTGQAEIETTEHDHQQGAERRELRLQIDHDRHDGRSDLPEQQPCHQPGARAGNFRRVASMDSPSAMASAEEAVPEEADEQAGGDKQGTGGAVHFELFSPGSSERLKNQRGMKRSLSVGSRWALVSRHCRRSSSLLPF